MSTPTDEIAVDLEAADAKAAAEAAKKGANGADLTDAPEVTVEKTAAEASRTEKAAVSTEEGLEKLKKDLKVNKHYKVLESILEQRKKSNQKPFDFFRNFFAVN